MCNNVLAIHKITYVHKYYCLVKNCPVTASIRLKQQHGLSEYYSCKFFLEFPELVFEDVKC